MKLRRNSSLLKGIRRNSDQLIPCARDNVPEILLVKQHRYMKYLVIGLCERIAYFVISIIISYSVCLV